MLFDLGIVFAFQVLYGYVFYWIGLLVAAFMTGVMVGSLWMTRSLSQIKEDVRLFLKIEVAVTFLALAFPLIFLSLDLWLVFQKAPLLLHSVFLFLSVLSGCLIGLEFPLANKIYLKDSTGLGCTAGLLYSSDLLGGWIGGILGGVVLLPVLGFVGTFTILVALKVSVMLMLAISNKRFGPMWVLK
jgi:spermidine synthase